MKGGRGSAVAFLFVLVFVLVSPGATAVAQPVFGPTQDPLAGARAFGEKGCSKCHAVHGVGGTSGPDLGRIARARSFYELAAAMWNHLPRMALQMRALGVARPVLDPLSAADLVAFLYTLDYFDAPGDLAAGRRLFSEKRCIVCHQVGGTGGVIGPNLDFLKQSGTPLMIATDMWNHGPAMADAMRARGIPRPTFQGAELRDLLAFLRSASPAETAAGPLYVLPGRADRGRRLFAEKRCLDCHSIQGEGGRVGPDLGGRAAHRSLTAFAMAMWNKAPGMMAAMQARQIPVPRLQPDEMADLVAFLFSVGYFAEAGDARRGRDVIRANGCLGCHSVRGEGGKVAGDLARARGVDTAAGVIAALWNHVGLMAEVGERAKTVWPEIRPADMADLAAFLQTAGRTP